MYRKYTVNENYFSQVDSFEKAYYLGLLMSDGNISKKGYRVKLSLHKNDEHIIKSFKDALESNYPIKTISFSNPRWSNQKELAIQSKKMTEDLSAFGCISKKSESLPFPKKLSSKLYKPFIRGYFDGDGGITICYQKTRNYKIEPKISICGTIDFLNSLQYILLSETNLSIKIYPIKNTKKIFNLTISGFNQTLKFLEWLYDLDCPKLNRKFKRFIFLKRCKKLQKAGISCEEMKRLHDKFNI